MLAIDLHVHELCMHAAVRVLYSCAFIMASVFPQDQISKKKIFYSGKLSREKTLRIGTSRKGAFR